MLQTCQQLQNQPHVKHSLFFSCLLQIRNDTSPVYNVKVLLPNGTLGQKERLCQNSGEQSQVMKKKLSVVLC